MNWSEQQLAHAAWSRIAEPADPYAGALVGEFGAVEALQRLRSWARRDGPPPSRYSNIHQLKAYGRLATRLEKLEPQRELATAYGLGGRLVIPGEAEWPTKLDELGELAPFCLWVRGKAELLTQTSVAVVGSRACTAYGQQIASEFATGLSSHRVAVVSGGAYGIDASAHRATLAAGGTAIAVMAGGVDRLYPRGNHELLEEVIARGVVASEVPPGSAPMRQRFLSRNRIIAALASLTVVVEASFRSGALNTAGHAAELGRTVAAVPGPVTSAASAGCHRLLREGAVCVTDADEALELIEPMHASKNEPADSSGFLDGLDPLQARVLEALPARASVPVESLVTTSGLSQSEVLASLGLLELTGRAERRGQNWRRAR